MESLLFPLILILIFVVPMFFMSRQQKKQAAAHREMLDAISIGAEVQTRSGFYGLVVEVGEDYYLLETESGAVTKWAKSAVAQVVPETEETDDAEYGAEENETGSELPTSSAPAGDDDPYASDPEAYGAEDSDTDAGTTDQDDTHRSADR